uniref:Augerpeptide-s7a (Fragments) n=1 Tax=Terebra subulata TaxID=89435 RepID=AX7A_TERSU|nr:RecName: Full=Augerpeptide-s7a; Short=Agx-s7a; Flags: Precursor [Terebra subulata]
MSALKFVLICGLVLLLIETIPGVSLNLMRATNRHQCDTNDDCEEDECCVLVGGNVNNPGVQTRICLACSRK